MVRKCKYNRIYIMGSGGSGKTTLAKKISEATGLPIVYLDRLFFDSNWKKIDSDIYKEKITQIANSDKWVLDNRGGIEGFSIFIKRTDLVIFIDIHRVTCTINVLKRWIKSLFVGREETPDGSNNILYGDFLMHVWKFPHKHRQKYYDDLAVYEKEKVIMKKMNKKEINLIINRLCE